MHPPTLVTISLSHYCEKARWGLERAGIPYRERRHAPGFHGLAVRRLGGRHSTPALLTSDGVLEDSTAILIWADRHAASGCALYPANPGERAEALALEERFDTVLGPHVRRALYFGLLPVPAMTIPLMTYGVPAWERLLFPLVFRPLRRLMRSGMRIDAAHARHSVEQLMATLDDVGQRLADGRKYLVGDRFGAADIAFAALLAPAVFPRGYGVPLPDLEQLPAATAMLVRSVRATPAGAFCLRLYRDERR